MKILEQKFFAGLLGVFCNVTTVIMILTNRVFRLSAYTIMANVALADSIVMLIGNFHKKLVVENFLQYHQLLCTAIGNFRQFRQLPK